MFMQAKRTKELIKHTKVSCDCIFQRQLLWCMLLFITKLLVDGGECNVCLYAIARCSINVNADIGLQHNLLQWRRQYSSFSKTGLGQATFLGGIFLLFYTGIAFKLLNLLFILWWLAPFLFILFNKLNPQARPPLWLYLRNAEKEPESLQLPTSE